MKGTDEACCACNQEKVSGRSAASLTNLAAFSTPTTFCLKTATQLLHASRSLRKAKGTGSGDGREKNASRTP